MGRTALAASRRPGLAGSIALDAGRRRPRHPTGLPCWRHADALRGEVVDGIEQRAWVHHIQRLLVLGNLAMLAGVSPQEMAPVLGRY
jgi:hypothetical protein